MKQIIILILFLTNVFVGYSQNLKVATYNIRYNNPSDSGNLWQDRKDKVAQLIKYHDFEIMGIQEALNNQINDLDSLLSDYSWVGAGRDDGKQKGEYAAIFYKKDRFECLKNGIFWLSGTDLNTPNKGWDAVLPRICTWAIFKDKKNNKQFILMNTHFDHVGKIARVESAKLIIAKAHEFAKDLPLILTGDFNVDENSNSYATLAHSGFIEDTYEKSPIKYDPNSTFNNWGRSIRKKGRIDHIFVSKELKVKRHGILTDTYMGKFPSDHFPVLVDLEW